MTPEERARNEACAAKVAAAAPTLSDERLARIRALLFPPKTPAPEPKHRAP